MNVTSKLPKVKCPGCDKRFYREDHEFLRIGNRYWHKSCHENRTAAETKAEQDAKALEEYICTLFKSDYVSPRIRSQINNMVEQYSFTHSGILGTLKYWFEIKQGCISKANGGIGI